MPDFPRLYGPGIGEGRNDRVSLSAWVSGADLRVASDMVGKLI